MIKHAIGIVMVGGLMLGGFQSAVAEEPAVSNQVTRANVLDLAKTIDSMRGHVSELERSIDAFASLVRSRRDANELRAKLDATRERVATSARRSTNLQRASDHLRTAVTRLATRFNGVDAAARIKRKAPIHEHDLGENETVDVEIVENEIVEDDGGPRVVKHTRTVSPAVRAYADRRFRMLVPDVKLGDVDALRRRRPAAPRVMLRRETKRGASTGSSSMERRVQRLERENRELRGELRALRDLVHQWQRRTHDQQHDRQRGRGEGQRRGRHDGRGRGQRPDPMANDQHRAHDRHHDRERHRRPARNEGRHRSHDDRQHPRQRDQHEQHAHRGHDNDSAVRIERRLASIERLLKAVLTRNLADTSSIDAKTRAAAIKKRAIKAKKAAEQAALRAKKKAKSAAPKRRKTEKRRGKPDRQPDRKRVPAGGER